jgi:hypothetical protein
MGTSRRRREVDERSFARPLLGHHRTGHLPAVSGRGHFAGGPPGIRTPNLRIKSPVQKCWSKPWMSSELAVCVSTHPIVSRRFPFHHGDETGMEVRAVLSFAIAPEPASRGEPARSRWGVDTFLQTLARTMGAPQRRSATGSPARDQPFQLEQRKAGSSRSYPNQFRRWSRPGRGNRERLGRPWRKQALPPDSVGNDMKRHVLEGSDQCHGRRELLLASYLHVLCSAARVRYVPQFVGLVPLEVPPTRCVRVPVLWSRDEAANAARVLCAGFGSVTVIAHGPSLRQHMICCKRGVELRNE